MFARDLSKITDLTPLDPPPDPPIDPIERPFCTNNLQDFLNHCNLVIDFSLPDGSYELIKALLKSPKPLVCGVTGLKDMHLLEDLAKLSPVFFDKNMSLGIGVLSKIASLVSKYLRDFDIEILEMHHRQKLDAPSGTALKLANAITSQRSDLEIKAQNQDILNQKRAKNTLNIVSQRGGDIFGRHTVGFYGDGEYLELTHNATSRALFAKGALDAAKFVFAKAPGMYGVSDMLDA